MLAVSVQMVGAFHGRSFLCRIDGGLVVDAVNPQNVNQASAFQPQ